MLIVFWGSHAWPSFFLLIGFRNPFSVLSTQVLEITFTESRHPPASPPLSQEHTGRCDGGTLVKLVIVKAPALTTARSIAWSEAQGHGCAVHASLRIPVCFPFSGVCWVSCDLLHRVGFSNQNGGIYRAACPAYSDLLSGWHRLLLQRLHDTSLCYMISFPVGNSRSHWKVTT